ncbi:MAG: PP2C family serine/threonine-protein phosphatase [Verrucomicrobiota bacterium]|nr:PP2C family serine/threonine-protein phosphatase [Verrucomicrobiota bacterium]
MKPKEWRAFACSVQGKSHAKRNEPCQDAHAFTVLEGILIFVVADGAGSASMGEVGAKIAASTACEAVARTIPSTQRDEEAWRKTIMDAVTTARDRMITEAESKGGLLREYACTLMVGVCGLDFITGAQVGDGAIIYLDAEGTGECLIPPSSGEYINETNFLTAERALELISFKYIKKDVRKVAAFSDGLQMLGLKMKEGKPHLPFFIPLFNFLAAVGDIESAKRDLQNFLSSDKISARTDDDLTLFLAVLGRPLEGS